MLKTRNACRECRGGGFYGRSGRGMTSLAWPGCGVQASFCATTALHSGSVNHSPPQHRSAIHLALEAISGILPHSKSGHTLGRISQNVYKLTGSSVGCPVVPGACSKLAAQPLHCQRRRGPFVTVRPEATSMRRASLNKSLRRCAEECGSLDDVKIGGWCSDTCSRR